MIAPSRPVTSVALAALVAVAGCVAPAPQGSTSAGQGAVISSASASVAHMGLPQTNEAEGCTSSTNNASQVFAAAARVIISGAVSCADLGPGGNLVAGCETAAADAMTRQPLTCAAIKPSEMRRYAACKKVAPKPAGEQQSCEAKSPPAPDVPIEVGSPTGPGYIYKSRDLLLVRTVTGSGQEDISSRRNPDGTYTIETRAFTATRDRHGNLIDVQFRDEP